MVIVSVLQGAYSKRVFRCDRNIDAHRGDRIVVLVAGNIYKRNKTRKMRLSPLAVKRRQYGR